MLYACLKWFKQSNFKNLKGSKTLKERWWVFSKWSGGLKKKCVGGWVFTIFYWRWFYGGLGIWMWFILRLHVHMKHQHHLRLSKLTWHGHFAFVVMSTYVLTHRIVRVCWMVTKFFWWASNTPPPSDGNWNFFVNATLVIKKIWSPKGLVTKKLWLPQGLVTKKFRSPYHVVIKNFHNHHKVWQPNLSITIRFTTTKTSQV